MAECLLQNALGSEHETWQMIWSLQKGRSRFLCSRNFKGFFKLLLCGSFDVFLVLKVFLYELERFFVRGFSSDFYLSLRFSIVLYGFSMDFMGYFKLSRDF